MSDSIPVVLTPRCSGLCVIHCSEARMSTFGIQTAVMESLPHAFHPMHENWRLKADALIQGLWNRGYKIVPRRGPNAPRNGE